MPAGEVDDAEAPVSQPYARTHEDTAVIRAAMNHGLVHSAHDIRKDVGPAFVFENSANAAHRVFA